MDGGFLVAVDLEEGEQAAEMQRRPHPLVEVEDPKARSEMARRLQIGDQLADSGAIDRRDPGEVEEDLLPVFREELVDDVAEDLVADSADQATGHIDDNEIPVLADFDVHNMESLARITSCVAPPVC
ncbi:MAG TPA: hypothetical protein VF580_06310, partial [Thermoanaerobaculia bacterium]